MTDTTSKTSATHTADSDEARSLLLMTASRLFADLCDKSTLDATEAGNFPKSVAAALVAQGFHRLAEPDSGFTLEDAYRVLVLAGYHALPLPLAEWMFANRWHENTSDDFVSIGVERDGSLVNVPWGRTATTCLALAADGALSVAGHEGWTTGANIAGEALDSTRISTTAPVQSNEQCYQLMALSRCALAVGALQRLQELVIEQVTLREQFGRPLARFQAVQHTIAIAAGDTAAATKALEGALAYLGSDRQAEEIAASCARVFEAVGQVTDSAHQLHGAMGFTHEHILHHYTRRLWSWREDYGNERFWQAQLGKSLCAQGADQLWPFLATSR